MPYQTEPERRRRRRSSLSAQPPAQDGVLGPAGARVRTGLAAASALDTARVLAMVGVPALAQGAVLRRPAAVAAVAALDGDRRAVRLLQRLRERYDTDALALRTPGRDVVMLLSAQAADRVLDGTPVPYSPATVEKRAALSHFQPTGVLISDGPLRARRRALNEAVLDTDLPMHRLAAVITTVAQQEMTPLLSRPGRIEWRDFAAAYWRLVRRIVLGDDARDDVALIALLDALRRDANWAYLRPRRHVLFHRFRLRLATHLDLAEPGSLAWLLAQQDVAPDVDPYGQVPHWLFAFDAAGATAFRTLALLSTHAPQRRQVREELAAWDPAGPPMLPYLSACVLETVRLWPTTLAVLRESTAVTVWDQTSLPRGTSFVIFSALLNRDGEHLPDADRFQPDRWLDGEAATGTTLIPFSAGPAACPGRNLVLQTVTAALAALLRGHDLRLHARTKIAADLPLPYTLGHTGLGFTVTPA
jgi:cytochrome P450